jgi:magnesium chelatase subunit I
MSDLLGIIPSLTGKIELVYEGEQEGPFQVAMNLLDKSIRTLFVQYFPNPETLKKRRNTGKESVKEEENPYKSITRWFDNGNQLDLFFQQKDADKLLRLYEVDGLHALVKKFYPKANEKESALLMEFVLHGLSAYSLISKKIIENKIEFKDLIGSMVNLGSGSYRDDELDSEDFS